MFFPRMKLRPMMEFLSNKQVGSDGFVGVEIGVDRGYNSKNILQSLPIKMLYLVDPYVSYVQDDKDADHFRFKEVAHRRLKPFEDRICFIERSSDDAVFVIPDDSLDFVYVDGNHSYEFVKRDIELYFPKLVDGGVLGGHDFSGDCPGVCRAVLEFVEQNKLCLYSKDVDWWVVK